MGRDLHAHAPRTKPGELLAAVAVLGVLLVVFLWTPVTRGGAYTSVDLLQVSPLVRVVGPDYEVGNTLLTDPVLQMQPWLEWNRDKLRHGDLPVWNPYNGSGAPHLANYVSAVLSPFSLPRYLLPVAAGLLASAALKLFVLGLFTYLFLRRVAVSHLGGIVGASAFMFAAYNVVWLSWPHPGAAVCLPAGLYFAEVALQASTRARARLAWAGYAAAVLAAFLAGHPETLFFSWGMVLVYVPLRVLLSPDLRGERARRIGAFALAGVLAVGMSAVQLLPFLEYLHYSTSYEEGAERAQSHYAVGYAALHAFPELAGSPSTRFYEPLRLLGALKLPDGAPIQSNFNESVGFYVGLLALLLASVGAVAAVVRRSFVGLFLLAAGGVWLAYAHDLAGIGHTVGALPVVELSAINRSHPVWVFSVCGLAAFGFDALAGLRGRRREAAAGVAAAGTLLLALAVVLARTLVERTDGQVGLAIAALERHAIDDHVRYISLTFLAGVAVLAALAAFGSRRWARVGACAGVVAVVFAQSGFLLRDYNPTIDERLFYPESPGLQALSAAAGASEDTVSVGMLLSADANLMYRLRSPDTYDGVGVYRYDLLRRRLAALPEPARSIQTFDVLGIRYVASEDAGWPTGVPAAALAYVDREATFTSLVPGLNGIAAYVDGPFDADCVATVELVDTATAAVVGRSSAPCKLPFTALGLPRQPDSAGRTYTARFGGNATTLAMVAWAAAVDGLEQVEVNDSVAVFRAPASPPRYMSPPAAVPVANDEEALRLLTAPGFSVAGTVLVHGEVDPEHAAGGAGIVETVSQRATEVRLKVTRDAPGWLLARQTWFPGWSAAVDGRPAELARADVAFTAVPVGAGTSDVVLRYRPASVRYGVLISALSLLALVAWVVLATLRPDVSGRARRRARQGRRARRRRGPEPPS